MTINAQILRGLDPNKIARALQTDAAGVLEVGPGGSAVDAFGRLRVSEAVTLFDNMFEYTTRPLLFTTSTSGGGSVAKTSGESSLSLSVGTASGDQAVNQTKSYFRYEPGKSQLYFATGVLGAKKTNVQAQLGYFDANNGVFFEMDGLLGASVVVRSNVSGSPVDTRIPQAQWNIDRMDGSGPSGLTLDFSKTQIYAFDLQWLGVGSVAFALDINRQFIYVHQVNNANLIAVPYMNTANLPIRAQITNTGVTASPTVMKQICMVIMSEAGTQAPSALQFAAANGITSVAVTTQRPVLSIRPKALYAGLANHSRIVLQDFQFLAATNAGFWELIYNPVLTGASFADVDTTNSAVQFDVSASALTGGVRVDAGYLATGTGTGRELALHSFVGKLPFTIDLQGNLDIWTLAVTSISGTCNVNAAMAWTEER